MSCTLRLLVSIAAGVGLVVLLSDAMAYENVSSTFGGNVARVQAATLSSGNTVSNVGAGVRVEGPVRVMGPGGRSAAATLQVDLSKKAAATIAAKALRILPIIGTGLLIWDMYDSVRVRRNDGLSTGLGRDLGQNPIAPGGPAVWQGAFYDGTDDCKRGGPVAAGLCSLSLQHQTTAFADCTYNGGSPQGQVSCVYVPNGNTLQTGVTLLQDEDEGLCPDFTDPATGYLISGGQPGPDNKCPTGLYTTPLTPEEAADRLRNAEHLAALDYAELLRQAIGGDIPPQARGLPIEQSADHKQTIVTPVPALVGPTTQTTDSTGTTTEAIGWNFRRREDDLRRNTGTWPQTTTRTRVDTAGNPTPLPTGVPATTVTDPNPSDANPDAAGDVEIPDFCIGHPERIGCAQFGQVEDAELPVDNRNVSIPPMAGWGSGGGSCPAPQVLSLGIGQVTMSNDMLCSVLGALSYIIIGCAGLIAARIFIGGMNE